MGEMIREHNLTRVVVASCSPSTHEGLFQENCEKAGLNRYLFEMANIRDQNSWVHMHEPEAATEKAKDLVRMAIAKAEFLKPLKPGQLTVNHAALIIGGGLAGITAALALADQGFESTIVEKEVQLGGNYRRLHYTLEGVDTQRHLADLLEQIEKNPLIQVFTGGKHQKDRRIHRQLQDDPRPRGRAKRNSSSTGSSSSPRGPMSSKTEEYLAAARRRSSPSGSWRN